MNKTPAQEAISAALKGDWEKAIELNEKILLEDKNNVDALNRLARAWAEKGEIKKAKALAKKVLSLDTFNSIATKCLQKWSTTNGHILTEKVSQKPKDARTYLEEPGKTKITSLLHLGDIKTLAGLDSGDELKFNAFQHRVSVVTNDGSYVGRLTDDLSARLRKLIKYGNKYEVLVKSVEQGSVKIFIRELERVEKLRDIHSFPSEKIDYISFTPPQMVHKKGTPQLEE